MAGAEVPVNLALQGGGSHGALTWGVLDRLLEEPRLRLGEISGTSAGAMNAVMLAQGAIRGGREGARAALRAFWKRISDAARLSPIRRSAWDRLRGDYSLDNSPGYLMAMALSQVFPPQMLNPLDFNPLRDLLREMVDFAALNAPDSPRLHLSATNVRSGQARIFSTGEITLDAVMASACLPHLYRAVEIEGEAYWDGGYTANPALKPLVVASPVRDLLLVKLNPMRREGLPQSARDIINRENEISFNTSLIKELQVLDLLRQLREAGRVDLAAGSDLRLHMIHCAADVQELSASSKLNAEWSYLEYLFERGRAWAQDWLDRHLQDLGRRSSFRLEELFQPPPRPQGLGPICES